MPIRNTTHILKNSDIVNRPLPSTLLKGEPIVNTAEGIVYFSGVTTSTSEWTPAGTGTTSNFFEVGSNLYDLKLRNRILSYNGLSNLSGKFLSGTTNGFVLADISSIVSVDTYVTGFTYDNSNNYTILRNLGQPSLSINVSIMTGLTVNGTISAVTLDATNIISGGTNLTTLISNSDTYATGYTYTPSTNTFVITGNNNFSPLSTTINSVSGLSVSNLTAGRVVYVGSNGLLTDEGGFTYDSSTNVLSVPSDGTVNVGTGGLNVSGNAVIQGSLTVFGSAISAFTNELYVEDPNITLNYNPTGSTIATSIGSGISVQDGNGITNGTVNLNINRLDSLTGLTINNIPDVSEYVASTGYANRGWITQLNDIVIRSTDVNTPNGVRVLAEFDILDGGTF